MSKYPVRHPVEVRRARRIGYFCREIKRALLNMCLDHNVTTRYIDDFIDEFFLSLEYHECEYAIEHLVVMLIDQRLIEHTFDRYRGMLT